MSSTQTRTILVKLSGELLTQKDSQKPSSTRLRALLTELKKVPATSWAFVIGGGNFFRGSTHSKEYGVALSTGHYVGMLSTCMNSLLLHDILMQEGFQAQILSAFTCPVVGDVCSPESLARCKAAGTTIVFAGGIGAPYFSTDTAAIVRALQIQADEVWKITGIDGIYSDDPRKNPQAVKLETVTYSEYLAKNLQILDPTAIVLAQQHKLPIRVFSHDEPEMVHQTGISQFGSQIIGD